MRQVIILMIACLAGGGGTVGLLADETTDGGTPVACETWNAPSGYRYVFRGGGCQLERATTSGPNYDDPNLSGNAADGPLHQKSIDELMQDLDRIQRRINEIGQGN